MDIEAKLAAMGLTLPAALQVPPGLVVPFIWIRQFGSILYISGHAPQNPDGSVAEPRGKVGVDLTLEEGYAAAQLTALAILGSIKREIGDLDRVSAWLKVRGMVNAAPDFVQTTQVINGFSDLILELYGDDIGKHSRTAVGASTLPLGVPVIIDAEVAVG